nr:MAG: replication associated protein [Arizlama virus]
MGSQNGLRRRAPVHSAGVLQSTSGSISSGRRVGINIENAHDSRVASAPRMAYAPHPPLSDGNASQSSGGTRFRRERSIGNGSSVTVAQSPEPRVEPIPKSAPPPKAKRRLIDVEIDEDDETFLTQVLPVPEEILAHAQEKAVETTDKSGFRVQANRGLFTWSDLGPIEPDKKALQDQMEGRMGAEKGMVAIEKHQNGSYHVHAMLHFPRKKDCNLMPTFRLDITKDAVTVAHRPNYKKVVGTGWVDYLKKEKNYFFFGGMEDPTIPKKLGASQLLGEAIVQGTYSMELFKTVPGQMRYMDQWNKANQNWLNYQAKQLPCGKPIVIYLWGPSGAGKTHWATSQFSRRETFVYVQPAAGSVPYINQAYNPHEHKVFIFDNISEQSSTGKDTWCVQLDQYEATLPVKNGEVTMKAPIRIITSTKPPAGMIAWNNPNKTVPATGVFDNMDWLGKEIHRRITLIANIEVPEDMKIANDLIKYYKIKGEGVQHLKAEDLKEDTAINFKIDELQIVDDNMATSNDVVVIDE